MDSAEVNLLSLCSGVGMLDEAVALGCASLGWRARTVGYCERDAYAAACLLARMEEQSMEPAPVWAGDMRDFDGRQFRGVVDIVAAGLPCQPYSCAGKQQGNSDRRSWGDGDGPIPNALRIIAECRPAMVFLENVPAWVRGGWFRPFGEELCRLGYTIEQPLFVTAESVGASHRRERVFVLAHRDSGRLWQRTDRGQPHAESDGWNDAGGGGVSVAHASGTRQQERPGVVRHVGAERSPAERDCGVGLFAPGPGVDWRGIPESIWPAIESGVRVLADGLALVVDASRADQLRCAGNGVVAIQGAAAFVELVREIRER